jgi:hypothetical protein
MKKSYTKPTLVRHTSLTTITAITGNGIVVGTIARGES